MKLERIVCAVVFVLSSACGGGEGTPPGPADSGAPVEESGAWCSNGIDDDGDSLIDCDDPGCRSEPVCAPAPVETGEGLCSNGIDDDGDSLIDCDDPGCRSASVCAPPPAENTEAACSNGIDDDRDSLVDCSDPDCARTRACAPPPAENTEAACSNGIDDDRDSLIDCDDPDCAGTMACRPVPEASRVLCSNGLDDDRDGAIDCEDPDCFTFVTCAPGTACGPVPASGRCASAAEVELCAAATGDGGLSVVRYRCLTGESCALTEVGAECVLTSACREGEQRCIDATRVQVCSGGAWSTSTCPRSCLGTAIGDGCAPDVSTRSTTGVVRYEYRGPNSTLTDWGPLATANAQGFVAASARLDRSTGQLALFDAVVTTLGVDSTGGRFSIRVPSVVSADDYLLVAALGVDGSGRSTHMVANPGYAPSTVPRGFFDPMPAPDMWAWAFPLSGRIDGSEYRITEGMGSGAARVFDYLRYTQGITSAHFAPASPRTVIAWVGIGTRWECGACAAAVPYTLFGLRAQQQVWIAGGADAGYWSDAVTAHEFGHAAMNAYGVSPGEGGRHILGIPVQPGMAWSEGWATFFGADVRNEAIYFDKQGGGFFWFDIGRRVYGAGDSWTRPVPSGGLFQPIDENDVAAMMWTLSAYVPRGELWDALASPRLTRGPFERGYTRRTWTDPTRPFLYTDTGVNAPSFPDYLDALLCQGRVAPSTVDLATQPTTRYPYPSRSPLCR